MLNILNIQLHKSEAEIIIIWLDFAINQLQTAVIVPVTVEAIDDLQAIRDRIQKVIDNG